MSEGYNGWANYETWLVALWINNEQPSYNRRREIAREVIEEVTKPKWNWWTIEDARKSEYAERLQAWVEEDYMPISKSGLAADLLNAAFSEVDWREIAENWLEDENQEVTA